MRAFIILGLGGALALADPAAAGQLYISGMSLANGYEIVGFQHDPSKPEGGWNGGWEYTGQQMLTANPGTSYDPAHRFNIFAWCVDVDHYIFIGGDSIVYTPSAPIRDDIARLALWGNRQLAASGPDNLISAAVQATIWDAEYNVEIVPGSKSGAGSEGRATRWPTAHAASGEPA
jgi:hypothetical protein